MNHRQSTVVWWSAHQLLGAFFLMGYAATEKKLLNPRQAQKSNVYYFIFVWPINNSIQKEPFTITLEKVKIEL